MYLRTARLLVLAGTPLLAGCATVFTPPDPPLTLRTRPDSVIVRHTDGRVLGIAPVHDLRVRPADSLELSRDGWRPVRVPLGRRLRTSFGFNAIVPGVLALGALEAGADPGDVLLLGLAVPAGALVDLLTGAAWEHQSRELDVALVPLAGPLASAEPSPPPVVPAPLVPPASTAPLPDPPLPSLPLPDLPGLPLPDRPLPDLPANPARATVAATLLLRGMARAADEAGCDPVVAETWLDESDLIGGAGAVSRDDSVLIGRKVQVQVDSVRAELRTLCARSNPLLDSLRAARTALAAGPPADSGTDAMTPERLCGAFSFGHCITFASGSATMRPEHRPALEDAAGRIRSLRLPVLVIIEGTADPSGDPAGSRRLGLARAAAVRDALVRLGVPADWLAVESCGDEPRCQLVPGASGAAPGAELNRRVAFHLRMREERP